MFGPFTAVLLTTLALLVAVVVSPLTAQESREPFGIYDDWSVHRLQDGDLRVCYAQTKLISPREVENGLGDVRLQVTSRSLSGSSDMIRVTPTSEFSDNDYYVMINSTLVYGVSPGVWVNVDHTSVVNQMKAGEAAKSEMVIWNDSDRTSVGGFSLRGFTTAYNAVKQLCPKPRATRAAPQPIGVSDISVDRGPPVRYSEFTVTGPFFQSQKADRIKIRAVPSEYAPYEIGSYANKENGWPLGVFMYGSQRLEFYHDEALIDVLRGSYKNEIEGACLDPETGLLKIVMHSWDGGASNPGTASVVYFDPNKRIIQKTVAWSEGGVPTFHCSEGESSWQWGGHFLPCQCGGRVAKGAYFTTLDEVVLDIPRFYPDNDRGQRRIEIDTFSSLLSQISRIEPFTQWDTTSSLDVQCFESSRFTVAVITYTDHANVYNCEQTTYVRRRTDDFWVPVYTAPVSSKAFHTLEIHGFIDDENLDITMCVADCYWWGKHDRVTKNVVEWHQTALNSR
ncbi:MAG: hypothetical protein OXH16_16270 [Gemmatimonadetes bacterium]|nr:hypothetical protein [Gemmatimonadota bacterium]